MESEILTAFLPFNFYEPLDQHWMLIYLFFFALTTRTGTFPTLKTFSVTLPKAQRLMPRLP